MQYCVSGSASNLITLIYPDLQVLGTILLSSHYACIVAARPILALCLHWRCAPQPMRILSSWLVKEYCKLQCSIAYPDLHQIKRNDTHQSAISGEYPLKTSGLKRSVDETSRRPRREGRHRKVRNKEGIDIEINTIRTSLVQGGTTRTGDNKSKNNTQYKRVQ